MSATVYEKDGSKLTVKPEGRLDTATSPMLLEEMRPYLDGVQELTMDFSNVEYVSSGGLRMLVEVRDLLEEWGGTMQLIHVNEYILEVFDMVDFMSVVTVIPD